MPKVIAALPEWSPHRIWLSRCGRRVWLYENWKLAPPQTQMQKIGQFIHELISLSIDSNRRLETKEIILLTTEILGNNTHVSLVISKLDSFYSIARRESDIQFVEAEKQVRIVVDNKGHNVKDPAPREGLSHVLRGRVDAICRFGDTLINRDFKSSFNEKTTDMDNIRTQFGVYRICLQSYAIDYGCSDIKCQIVNLSSGKIIDIEPYDTGQIMSIVKKAQKRYQTARGVKAKSHCHDCSFSTYCDNPQRAPKEWKRKFVDQPSLL